MTPALARVAVRTFALILWVGLLLGAVCASLTDEPRKLLPPTVVVRVQSASLREFRGATLLRFSPDGTRLAVVAGGRLVILADVATGAELAKVGRSQKQVAAVEFSTNGRFLTVAGSDELIQTWDIASGKLLRTIQLPNFAGPSFTFSAGGHEFAYTNSSKLSTPVEVIDVRSGREPVRLGNTWPDTIINPWESLPPESAYVVRLSPDGKLLAAWEGRRRRLTLWDVVRGEEFRQLRGNQETINALVFSPNGRMLAAGDKEAVSVWETVSGKQRRLFQTEQRPVSTLAFSVDGRYLLVGTWAKDSKSPAEVELWDLAGERRRVRFGEHTGDIRAVACAPDGKRVATAGADGTVLIWDTTAYQARRSPTGRSLSAKELEALWADLGADDARRAYDALWSLVAAPEQGVPLVDDHLWATQAEAAQKVARLIAELGDRRFSVREKAGEALRRLGELAEPAMRHAMENPSSDEIRRRLQRLLPPPAAPVKMPASIPVSTTRALEVLEYAATPKARVALRRLAQRATNIWLAQQAAGALRRLGKSGPGK
jgi:WD40 repeat protein